MAGDGSGRATLPTCVNGHRMLVGSTVCPVCSAPVKRSTVPRVEVSRPTAHLEPEASADEPSTDSSRARILIATAAALVLMGGGVAAMLVLAETEPPSATPTGFPPTQQPASVTCRDLGLDVVPIDAVVPGAPAQSCFNIQREILLTLGAEPNDAQDDLVLTLRKADGTFIAGADDTYGNAPELSSNLFPGTYVIEVTLPGGGTPGEFTLYSTVFDPDILPSVSITGGSQGGLPGVEDCGTANLPLISDGGVAAGDGNEPAACLELSADTWTKIGVIGLAEDASPDLQLALHRFDETGRPRFIRVFDDAFGTDPEASVSLPAGTYLLQVEEWNAQPVGLVQIYADTDQAYFREGIVSPQGADATLADCSDKDVRPLVVGGTIGFDDEDVRYTCLTLSRTTVVDLDVLSLSQQDLTLEVIGFGADGEPIRYAWADEFVFVSAFDDKDPRIQTALPAGTYYLNVYDFEGLPVGAYTISATEITVQ